MAVNDEEKSLQSAMAAACPLLAPGGRLAVISFHSIEDRIVKRFGVQVTRDYRVEGDVDLPEFRHPIRPLMRWIQKKPVVAGAEELADNPRARSAKLRVLEKI
jgi:16S rRNA (cytosine1402-N4)-methyltransferase